jgi:hypothetical protein
VQDCRCVAAMQQPGTVQADPSCDTNETPGGGAFLGLAAYSYLSGTSQLEQNRAQIMAKKSMFGMRSRKLGIAGISLGLAYLGIWRLVK